MKKILLIGFLIASVLSACDKESDQIFDETPDERLNRVLAEYKTQLVEAEYGWKATLFPAGGAGYSFLFDFKANNRVAMYGDINASTAAESLESTYRLKAVQKPSLLFDTYSYIHILSDPDRTKSGGDWGQGRNSDFEFSFEEVSADTITLIGNFNQSRLILVRATQQEAENFIEDVAEVANSFENVNNFTTYFKRLNVGGQSFNVSVNTVLRTITFSYFVGGTVNTFTTSYYYTQNGIALLEPFNSEGLTISSLDNITYSGGSSSISFTVNNIAGNIQEATRPIQINTQAARQFHNNPPNGVYWLNFTGFTVEGEEDALKLHSIPDFSLLVYWPKYGSSSGVTYDLMGFVFGNSIRYGPAAVPSFTSDGRIVYNLLGTLGTIPEADRPIVTAFIQKWTDPAGFYVIQTGANSYDLVSARDAKTWISFM